MPSRALYFVRNRHFLSCNFHPKYAIPTTIVFAMPSIEYCHVKRQNSFVYNPMTRGCSELQWQLSNVTSFGCFLLSTLSKSLQNCLTATQHIWIQPPPKVTISQPKYQIQTCNVFQTAVCCCPNLF